MLWGYDLRKRPSADETLVGFATCPLVLSHVTLLRNFDLAVVGSSV